jgi:hypothetical protein
MYGSPGRFQEIAALAERIATEAKKAAANEEKFGETEYWEQMDWFVAETRALAEELGVEVVDPREETEAALGG